MTANVATVSTKLRELAAERVELQALFDAGTETTADMNRVMVLNRAMDESSPGLVQELVELREWATLARTALEAWSASEQHMAEHECRQAYCEKQVVLALGAHKLLAAALLAVPGGSDG